MFADNVKVNNKSFSHDIVQMDVNNFFKWSTDWYVYLNAKKCNVLHSGERNTYCDYFMSVGEVL